MYFHGVLYADQSDSSDNLYFLSREWLYFPGQLLSPQDIEQKSYYSRYTSIGEYGGMELDDAGKSPYGSGTYRMFTFKGSDTVEILIAVSDFSAVSSGIRYIPVLGTPLKVNMFRGIRILFNGFTMTFCLCIMMGSLFLFIKDHAPEFGLFSLICLCILLYSSYPVIHTFLALPVQPVYALEIFGYYI